MRHLILTSALVAALAAGAWAQTQQQNCIIGDEHMIRGIASITLVGTYICKPKPEPRRAVFLIFRYTDDGGINYYCVARGKMIEKIKRLRLGSVITITGRHEREYLEGAGWTTVIKVNYIRAEQ